MLFRSFVVAFFFMCCGNLSYAQTAKAALLDHLEAMQAMQADFTETVKDQQQRVLQKLNGKISLQRPNKFRWQTLGSAGQLLVADGSRLWIYEPELQQASVQKFKESLEDTPAMLLAGDATLILEEYTVTWSDESKHQGFYMVPKDPNSLFKAITLSFNAGKLQHMVLTGTLGEKTIVTFRAVDLDPKFAADLFKFTPPIGVDILGDVPGK